jgi:GAF domain-containing protein
VGVEPLPETRAALSELSRFGDADLVTDLRALTDRARALVPQLVGVSLGALSEGLTFTFVASRELVAVLDAVQYLDGGPCVQAVDQNSEVSVEDADALDERGWLMFARAGAVAGIEATLTLPLMEDGHVVGSVNMYASQSHAFDGQHEALAGIFGAWAGGAVTNADLSFRTGVQAMKAPASVEVNARIDNAVGVIIEAQGVGAAEARERLEAAADLAGVSNASIADMILTSWSSDRRP